MDVTSVTLDEVLCAAQLRAASLVPETSGYLALAIADASARLPFRLDDALVSLTTEGTVSVARGSEVVPPEESARVLRRMLARLLERSVGSMPGLSAAGRARDESSEGVSALVLELESALVPVNRAAARRALARLARETARARDLGKLKRRARKAASGAARPPRAAAPAAAAPSDASDVHPGPLASAAPPTYVSQPTSEAASALSVPREESELEIDVLVELSPAEPTPTELVPSVFETAEGEPEELAEATIVDAPVAERHDDDAEAWARDEEPARPPRPSEAPAANGSRQAKVVLSPQLATRRGRGYPTQREATIEPSRSDVDSLLSRFASASGDDLLEAQEQLATSLGIAPSRGRRPSRATTPSPAPARHTEDTSTAQAQPTEPTSPLVEPVSSSPRPTPARSSRAGWIALLALGLAAAGLVGHLAPGWTEPSDQAASEPR